VGRSRDKGLKEIRSRGFRIQAPAAERRTARSRQIMVAHLRSLAGEVLGFDLSREFDCDQGLFDMGMDTLIAVELKGRLERSLGVTLPSTLTFNSPISMRLPTIVLGELLGSTCESSHDEKAPPSPSHKILPTDARSEDLSEDEISLLLLLLPKKLEQMK